MSDEQPRRRFGRLQPTGAGRHETRCVCDECGAHLLATAVGGGAYRGVCLVCGSEAVSPLPAAPPGSPPAADRSPAG